MWVADRIERRAVNDDANLRHDLYKPQRGRRVVTEVPDEVCSNGGLTAQQRAELAELADIKASLKDLRQDNQKLQNVVNDVMEVNKRWQRHHSERELHIQKLLNTIADLQKQQHNSATVDTTASKEASRVVQGPPPTVSASPERLALLEAENARLRLELESARRRQQALERQHREHADLLQIQVRSYKDDWEAERSEKEQVTKEKQAAEERTKELQHHINILTAKGVDRYNNIGIYNVKPDYPKSHLSESSSAPAVSCGCARHSSPPPSPAANIKSASATTFRTSLHLPCGNQHPSAKHVAMQKKDLEGYLSHNIDLDSPRQSQVSSKSEFSSPTHSPTQSDTSLPASPSTTPITIGFEGGLASVQSFTFPGDSTPQTDSKKVSVLQIAAPPLLTTKVALDDDQGTLTQTSENVACPKCGRIFPPDRHIQFLDHFDECTSESLSFMPNYCVNPAESPCDTK